MVLAVDNATAENEEGSNESSIFTAPEDDKRRFELNYRQKSMVGY